MEVPLNSFLHYIGGNSGYPLNLSFNNMGKEQCMQHSFSPILYGRKEWEYIFVKYVGVVPLNH